MVWQVSYDMLGTHQVREYSTENIANFEAQDIGGFEGVTNMVVKEIAEPRPTAWEHIRDAEESP